MPDDNEYSGSGHFVGESEPLAPITAKTATKKSSVVDRQIVKNNGATVAEAKDVDHAQVGKNALAISEALGNPEPSIGDAIYGVAKQAAPYVLGAAGLAAAWHVLSSNKGQTSNDGANGGWGKTNAGRPENAKLGAPQPAAIQPPTAPIAPTAPEAPVPPVATAVPTEPTVDPIQQAKLDSMKAAEARAAEAHANEQRRKDEIHANRLAKDVQKSATDIQSKQGKSFSPESILEIKSDQNRMKKDIDAVAKVDAQKTKAIAPAPSPALAPAANPTQAPVVAPTAAVPPPVTQPAPIAETPVEPVVEPPKKAPKTSNMKEISLPKDWPAKGMNWLTSQYGEQGARQFINEFNKGEPFKTHEEMTKVYDQVMTKPSFSSVPKDTRKSRGITRNPESQQYKIIPNAIVPPTLPSGGGAGMVVPRTSLGNTPGANEQIHSLNPLKL